jgi:hypothetical protein
MKCTRHKRIEEEVNIAHKILVGEYDWKRHLGYLEKSEHEIKINLKYRSYESVNWIHYCVMMENATNQPRNYQRFSKDLVPLG